MASVSQPTSTHSASTARPRRNINSNTSRTSASPTYVSASTPPYSPLITPQADFDLYQSALSETGAKLPTQSYLKRKIDDIKAFENRFWTDADINARIARSTKFAHLLKRDSADAPAPRIPTQSEVAANRLAEINRMNRKAEQERLRKAQIEERQEKMKARKRAEIEARKKRAEEERQRNEEKDAKAKNDLLGVDDLFDGGSSRGSSVPRDGPKVEKVEKKPERKGLPTFRKPKMDDDIMASMDIGLDIEI